MTAFIQLCLVLSIITNKLATAISPALILSPFISQNRTDEARKLSAVDPSLFLNVTSYSGFLTVDATYNSNLFFWYFPVRDRPIKTTPWIIWLQGGPGASSLAGLFDEIGPFQYNKELGLKIRESSWWREYSLVFIDNPVGAGYSFTNSQDGFARNMAMYSSHLYKAVVQLVTLFPELQNAPLYLAGESYAGHYIPGFGIKTLEEMNKNKKGMFPYNLKGLVMGNPVLDRASIANFTSVFYHWGLIDSQGVIAANPLQEQYIQAVEIGNSSAAVILRDQLLDKLQEITSQNQVYNILHNYGDLKDFMDYIMLENVREALHVGTIKFTFSNASVHKHLVSDFLAKMSPTMNNLLEHCKVLIYCGQLDLTAPCVPAAEWRRQHWRWSGRESFLKAPRVPWWYNESVAGYVKSGGGFTETLIRGAGHLAPIDKAEQVRQLVSYFIRGLDMPMPPNYEAEAEYTPEYTALQKAKIENDDNNFKTGMLISISVNVILVIIIVLLIVFVGKWKKRDEDYLYAPLSDGILTMT
ncbi:unnamed protein product [Parnassius apollo]|uniref:Carboxypeptidase n=1 Tax=Parnassius apollo TaxID=110799 RepID=A0A8S3X565_PARAO|nr:unnamed protein product [Parnassius apollo]